MTSELPITAKLHKFPLDFWRFQQERENMYASKLIEHLSELVNKHGDLPVTVVFANTEYSPRGPWHTEKGPCCNIADTQNQSPPERLVFELKDDVPELS